VNKRLKWRCRMFRQPHPPAQPGRLLAHRLLVIAGWGLEGQFETGRRRDTVFSSPVAYLFGISDPGAGPLQHPGPVPGRHLFPEPL
jgi:hypothetical protein